MGELISPKTIAHLIFNSDLLRQVTSPDAVELAKEVAALRDKHQHAAAQNEHLRELNKLLLRKLMHLNRAVQLIGQ